ncbi:alpha/beta hydrolase [Aquabacterium sp. A7-Y]|uniref:alpha/beta fold hydrolase n=1 Tax=Aquabacterium sp. A7-Y TaxID=1349605 RepID=UPI00223D1AE2|nr:alpha/beta hydrolase [Aquabacterium sp. A7-Y]MCW7538129.1 alpha/beta hydrolase [Aquabacterium sp. A7-Y]
MKLEVQGREAYAYTGGRPFDAARPCVVMIHGALNDHSVWALQSRYLAHHGHAVLAVDLPGHGRSAGPALPDVESLAGWIVALLDAAGVARAALVGHSMGSLIALEAAAALGERATALSLVGTAYPMKVSAAMLDTALQSPQRAIDQVTALSHSTLAAKPSAPGPGSWLHGVSRALMRRLQAGYAARHEGANLFHHDFTVCDRYAGAEAAAARLRCPVQLVLGRRDQMTPPRATATLAQLAQATVLQLDAGHALMAEAPDGVLDALKAFLPPAA